MSNAVVNLDEVRQKQPNKIAPRNFQQAEYAYSRFSATLPVGHSLDDALQPEYWAAVSHVMASNPATRAPDRTGAIIEVRKEDHSLYAELYVRQVMKVGLVVSVIRCTEDIQPKQTSNDGKKFITRWNVGAKGFDIIRTSDNKIVGQGKDFKLKEDAEAWIKASQ